MQYIIPITAVILRTTTNNNKQ